MREAQSMTDLITLIRSHLLSIKTACDLNQFGTQWTGELANIAHALYYQRIPDAWCEAIGPSAPLPTWGLNNFFNDLNVRAEHIEKVLTKGKDYDKDFLHEINIAFIIQVAKNIQHTIYPHFSMLHPYSVYTNRRWHMH